MSLAGRPPLNLGVTNSGNFYGNTQVTFTDITGDQEISFYAGSAAPVPHDGVHLRQHRTARCSTPCRASRRTTFYYGQDIQASGALYDPRIAPFITRDLAESVSRQRGGTVFGIYPFNRYNRLEVSTGYMHMSEEYTNAAVQQEAVNYQIQQYGQSLLRNGHMIPFGVSLVNETTIFREYGPVAGSTFKVSYEGSPAVRQQLDLAEHR